MSSSDDYEIEYERHREMIGWLKVIAASLKNIERIQYEPFNHNRGEFNGEYRRPGKPEQWESDAKAPK